MSSLDPALPQDEVLRDASIAPGGKLLTLWTSITGRGGTISDRGHTMSEWEETILTECFHSGAEDPTFRASFIKSLRVALEIRGDARFDKMAILFKKAPLAAVPETVLEPETDILPSTVRTFLIQRDDPYADEFDSGAFRNAIADLLRYGARINGVDHYNNTALYYACVCGRHGLFQFLLQAGARTSTVHQAMSDQPPFWLSANDPQIQSSGHQNQNLLQTTLKALSEYGPRAWNLDLGSRWGRIAADLDRLGVPCAGNEPSLVVFFHIACFQGNMMWVERMLKHFGVSIHSPCRQDSQGKILCSASALNAAAAGAQADIVRLLLSLGADPLLEGLSTCHTELCKGHNRTTLGMVPVASTGCPNYRAILHVESEHEAVYHTINALLDCQADAEIYLTMLEQAVRTGQSSIVGRLLGLGFRITTFPSTTNCETIPTLLEHGCTFDLIGTQKNAVVAGDRKMLLQLIEKSDDSLTSMSPHELCKLALSHGQFDMFRFLFSRYVSDINKIWRDKTQDSGETLLQMACVLAVCELDFCDHRRCSRPASIEAISFLLQAGADPMREQMEDALTTFQQAISSRRIKPENIVSLWPTLRQLESHMPPSHSERTLSTDIHAAIRRQQTSPHSQTPEPDLASNDPYGEIDKRQQARTDITTVASVSMAHQQLPPAAVTPRPNGEEFEHSPLTGPSKSAIRILTLWPSDKVDALIECLVTEVDLAELPVYKALSYVWGTTSASKRISVNGKDLRITTNLHDALKRLRHSSGSQILWIDAICIDQDNISERNQQVAIMGDIYRHAQCVLVWLGEHAEDSHYYFQKMGERALGEFDTRANAAFDRLCQRPWFFRTWVIQEIVLSKCAFIHCGPETVPWDKFRRSRRKPDSQRFHPLHGWSSSGRIKDLDQVRNEMILFDGRLSGYSRHATWSSPSECVHLPDYSRSCQSTDPKDRIYGILGLFPPGLMHVDYNQTLQEIFTQFAQTIFQLTGNIGLLHEYSVRPTLSGLPSWVPDFSSMSLAGTLPRKTLPYSKLLDEKAASVAVYGHQLLIKGMVVDSIRQIGSEMPVSTENAVGTLEFIHIMLEWETLAASLNAESFFMDAVSDAFLATIVANDPSTYLGISFREPGVIWYRSCGTGLLGTKEPTYFEDVEYYTDLMDLRSHDSPILELYSSRLERAVYGRRFFITEKGSMGLAGPMAQEGDQIVLFPGQNYPFIVRDTEEKGSSTMHGDCYLHGLDVGSFELWESDPASIRQFVII
ncbi:heterokaryon incompatibility protein-domain-containing protein [Phyllosticta capitalensis]